MDTIFIAPLRKRYDKYADVILGGYLNELPKLSKFTPRSFQILKDLPSPEEYRKMRDNYYTWTVGDACTSIEGDVETLAEEFQNWYDNTPGQLQCEEKGCEVESCASALADLQMPEPSEKVSGITFVHLPDREANVSRPRRYSEVCSFVESVLSALDDVTGPNEAQTEEDQEFLNEIDDFRSELDSYKDELEGIEIPVPFG